MMYYIATHTQREKNTTVRYAAKYFAMLKFSSAQVYLYLWVVFFHSRFFVLCHLKILLRHFKNCMVIFPITSMILVPVCRNM